MNARSFVFLFLATLGLLVSCSGQNPALETPVPVVIENASQAIAAVQRQYPEVADINPVLTPQPFDPDYVVVFDRDNQWDLIFVTGSGDCPSGCLNNYYWYFSVVPEGRIEKMGEYSSEFDPSSNGSIVKGSPLWGYPR